MHDARMSRGAQRAAHAYIMHIYICTRSVAAVRERETRGEVAEEEEVV